MDDKPNPTTMSPDQQQIAIEKACEWEPLPEGYYHPDNPIGQTPPDYLNDLNACHEMEKGLFWDKWKWLAYVNNLNEMPSLQDEWLCVSIHATAGQRAEAFLRTLGLWQEPPTQPQ
jgi:hypothetical protein